jgi:hypothetical protein
MITIEHFNSAIPILFEFTMKDLFGKTVMYSKYLDSCSLGLWPKLPKRDQFLKVLFFGVAQLLEKLDAS